MSERVSGTLTPKQNVTGQLARATNIGGTNDYNKLVNQPSIETVTLIGDKTFAELGLQRMTNTMIDEILSH